MGGSLAANLEKKLLGKKEILLRVAPPLLPRKNWKNWDDSGRSVLRPNLLRSALSVSVCAFVLVHQGRFALVKQGR